MQVKKQQLELDKEQWTGSNLQMKYIKVIFYHPAYLVYMQGTSCEMPGWMKIKLESRLLGEVSTTSDINATLMAESERGKAEPLDEGERGLKLA